MWLEVLVIKDRRARGNSDKRNHRLLIRVIDCLNGCRLVLQFLIVDDIGAHVNLEFALHVCHYQFVVTVVF